MIERTVTVKSAEFKDTKDGKRQYLSAITVGESGKEYTRAFFDPTMQKTVQEALKANLPLVIQIEKEMGSGGKEFWNIKSAEIATGASVAEGSKPVVAPQATPKPQYSGRTEKDDDILLAVAFKGATECEGYWYVPDGKAHNDRVLKNTAEILTGLMLLRPKREAK